MQDQWMRDGHGFLLVYSITSKPTFAEVTNLRDKIIRTKDTEDVCSLRLASLAGCAIPHAALRRFQSCWWAANATSRTSAPSRPPRAR
jgi:hypothetical protein